MSNKTAIFALLGGGGVVLMIALVIGAVVAIIGSPIGAIYVPD